MFCRIFKLRQLHVCGTSRGLKSVSHIFHIQAVLYSVNMPNSHCFWMLEPHSQWSRDAVVHTVDMVFAGYVSVCKAENKRDVRREIVYRGEGRGRLCCGCVLTPFLRNPAPRMNAVSLCGTGDSWSDFSRICSSSKATLHLSTQHLKRMHT